MRYLFTFGLFAAAISLLPILLQGCDSAALQEDSQESPPKSSQESPPKSSQESSQTGSGLEGNEETSSTNKFEKPPPKNTTPRVNPNALRSGVQTYQDCDNVDAPDIPSFLDFTELSKDINKPTHGFLSLKGWRKLPIKVFIHDGLSPLQEKLARYSYGLWEVALGKNLFHFKGRRQKNKKEITYDEDGTELLDDNKSIMYVGNYELDNAIGIAAYRYGKKRNPKKMRIKAADMYIKDRFARTGMSKEEYEKKAQSRYVYDVSVTRSIMIHEIGHMLGLGHVTGNHSVMSYQSPPDLAILSCGDIRRIQHIYGCKDPFCDASYVMRVFQSEEFQRHVTGEQDMQDPFNDPDEEYFILPSE